MKRFQKIRDFFWVFPGYFTRRCPCKILNNQWFEEKLKKFAFFLSSRHKKAPDCIKNGNQGQKNDRKIGLKQEIKNSQKVQFIITGEKSDG